MTKDLADFRRQSLSRREKESVHRPGNHRDLVTTLFQTLPTVEELEEPSGVANENDTLPLVDKDRSTDEEAVLFITQVPTSQTANTAPVHSCSTLRGKRKLTGKEGNPEKKVCNSIVNYFFIQN